MFDNENEKNVYDRGEDKVPDNFPPPAAPGDPRFAMPENPVDDYVSQPEPYPTDYKDAGYITREEAPVTPRTYYTPSERPERREREPRETSSTPPPRRRGGLFAGIVALCLICALLGGLGGAVIVREFWPGGSVTEPVPAQTAEPTPSPVLTSVEKNPGTDGALTGPQVYEQATRQVVGVSSEVTYTNVFGQQSASSVTGTGFVVSDDGYIMTNYHVIEPAYRGGYTINVMFYDGASYEASVVGFEKDNDVAVLKIEATGLTPVTLGDSALMKVGETVYAVGNPLGELTYTMTSGMISALDREISTDANTTINMFQIDAAVNSGNSGGPVYNAQGQVLGIVSAKYSESGVEGLGFAIPINDAIAIANELITKGYVSGKSYIGVHVEDMTKSVIQYYNMAPGAYVLAVDPGGSAEQAGIRAGDIIVRLGDAKVESVAELTAAKKQYKPGDTAEIEVYRSGEHLTFTLTFGEDIPDTVDQNQPQPTQTPALPQLPQNPAS